MELLKKYKEILLYLVFGVLTTIISLVIFFLLTKTILDSSNAVQLQLANIISWIISVLFAYFTNSKYVFNGKISFKELSKFASARISTLIVDMIIMFVFVSLLKFNSDIIKIFDQVVVIVLNYILSKILVFKKK